MFHLSISTHLSIAKHLSAATHPSIAKHLSIAKHPSIATHQSIATHLSSVTHPSIVKHPSTTLLTQIAFLFNPTTQLTRLDKAEVFERLDLIEGGIADGFGIAGQFLFHAFIIEIFCLTLPKPI